MANKCTAVADDDYMLLVYQPVQDMREYVRSQYCGVDWDTKKEVWHTSPSKLKRCLHLPVSVVHKGKPANAYVDHDPDPRSAHFVYLLVNSTDQQAWAKFGPLVHVNMPVPSKATGPALGALGLLLFQLEPSAAAIGASAAAIAKASEAAAAVRAWDFAKALEWSVEYQLHPGLGGAEFYDSHGLASVKRLEKIANILKGATRANPQKVGEAALRIVQAEVGASGRPAAVAKAVEKAGLDRYIALSRSEVASAAVPSAKAVAIESVEMAAWPMLAAQLIAWSITHGLDHSCPGKWYEERKKLIDTYYKNGGSLSYGFRVNTGGKAEDNYVEQTVLAHLKGDGAPAMFPLMQDRRPLLLDQK